MNCAEKLLEPTIFFNLYTSLREIAIQRNELQNFLDAWAPFKNLLNTN